MNSSKDFKIIFVDVNLELCQQLRKKFAPYKNVTVVCKEFQTLGNYDCLVVPGNSFGQLAFSKTIGAQISSYFGEEVVKTIQSIIVEEFDGEAHVGSSFICHTNNKQHPYLCYTPTMRIPYSIENTDYVYLAMKSTLHTITKFNKLVRNAIKVVACPGLGTHVGRVHIAEAARQMELAYRYFLNPPEKLTWEIAQQRQKEIIWGGCPDNALVHKDIKRDQIPMPSEGVNDKVEVVSKRKFYNMVILGEYLLVDCRPKEAYDKAHIEASINLPPEKGCSKSDLDKMKVYVDSKDKVLLYGDSEEKYKNQMDALIKYYGMKPEVHEILILCGGYENFEATYPWICEGTKLYAGESDVIFPAHIIENVYLGSSLCANNKIVLQKLNIKYVLNCTTEVQNEFENDKELNITYKRVPVEDSSMENITEYFEEAYEFIQNAINEKKNILVHCHYGISRSATIVIMYLMWSHHWSLEKSYKYTKKARHKIRPNNGFLRQLENFERDLFNTIESEQ